MQYLIWATKSPQGGGGFQNVAFLLLSNRTMLMVYTYIYYIHQFHAVLIHYSHSIKNCFSFTFIPSKVCTTFVMHTFFTGIYTRTVFRLENTYIHTRTVFRKKNTFTFCCMHTFAPPPPPLAPFAHLSHPSCFPFPLLLLSSSSPLFLTSDRPTS